MAFDEVRAVSPEVTASTDIVAVGGQITAASVLAGYRAGVFPMAVDVTAGDDIQARAVAWFSPAQRAVLRWPGMHVSRSLRRSARRFEVTVDADFGGVLDGCADPGRDHGWIDEDYRRAYLVLHAQGWAHSVEVWLEDQLVGGVLGVDLGGVFCADSKFHRVTDASKVALAGLSDAVFSAPGAQDRLIDAQWLTPHLARLGFTEIERLDYLGQVARLELMSPVWPGRRTT